MPYGGSRSRTLQDGGWRYSAEYFWVALLSVWSTNYNVWMSTRVFTKYHSRMSRLLVPDWIYNHEWISKYFYVTNKLMLFKVIRVGVCGLAGGIGWITVALSGSLHPAYTTLIPIIFLTRIWLNILSAFSHKWITFFSALVDHFFSGGWITFFLTIAPLYYLLSNYSIS